METHANYAQKIRLLIYKHAKEQLTNDEQNQLDEFINRSPENARLVQLMTTEEGYAEMLQEEAHTEKIWKGKHLHLTPHHHTRHKRQRNYWELSIVAALVLVLIIGAAYFLIWMSLKGE